MQTAAGSRTRLRACPGVVLLCLWQGGGRRETDVIGRAEPATTGQVKTDHLRKGRRLWVRSFLPAEAGRKERPDGERAHDGQGFAILTLHQAGWSDRRIARELGIHRETVGRHLRLARAENLPAGSDGSSKPATNLPTGSEGSGLTDNPPAGLAFEVPAEFSGRADVVALPTADLSLYGHRHVRLRWTPPPWRIGQRSYCLSQK